MTLLHTARAAAGFESAVGELLRNAVVGAIHTDMAGRVIKANRKAAEILGYALEELDHQTVPGITHPDDMAATLALIASVKAGGPGYAVEKRYLHKDGGVVWAIASVSALRDAGGAAVGMLALIQDITERKASERRLGFLAELSHRLARTRDEGEIVRIAVESVGRQVGAHRCYFVECYAEENRISVSHTWSSNGAASLEGHYSLFDFGGLDWWRQYSAGNFSIVDVETDPLTEGPTAAAYLSLQVRSYAVEPFRSEGPSTVVLAITDDRAREWTREEKILLENVIARVWPLVERARADRLLARSREETDRQKRFLETLLSVSPDYVSVFDRQHRFVYANRALGDFWGRPPGEMIGATLRDIGHHDWQVERHEAEVDRVFQTGQSLRDEVCNDGQAYEYIMVPVCDASGQVEYVMGLTRDVTESRNTREALRLKAVEKDEFIALLAHELRNPLAPLRNGLEVMRLASDDPKAVADVRPMMERQVLHLMRLVDDLLDASRMGLNKIELRRSRVLVSNLIADAVEAARPRIDAAHHALRVAVPLEPLFIDADLTRMAQVLGNLINNSVKYTRPGGRISIEAARVGEEVEISVSDTGIGIPAEKLETIFQMFSQVDRSVDRDTGGLGIGLGLVKGLVEMHGGGVRAKSDGLGRGSTFVVRLPLLAA
jgi:PAS domain S-box-containing protein